MISTPLRIPRTLKSVVPGPSNAPRKSSVRPPKTPRCESLSGGDPPAGAVGTTEDADHEAVIPHSIGVYDNRPSTPGGHHIGRGL